MRLSDAVSHAGLAIYAEIALLIFFVAFVVIVVRLWRRRDHDELERMRRLPLDRDRGPGAKP